MEEAVQLLRKVSEVKLGALEEEQLGLLVRLLICVQLQVVSISTACRKVDQVGPTLLVLHSPLLLLRGRKCSSVHFSFSFFVTDVTASG